MNVLTIANLLNSMSVEVKKLCIDLIIPLSISLKTKAPADLISARGIFSSPSTFDLQASTITYLLFYLKGGPARTRSLSFSQWLAFMFSSLGHGLQLPRQGCDAFS